MHTVSIAMIKSTSVPNRTLEAVQAANRKVFLSVQHDQMRDIVHCLFGDRGQIVQAQVVNVNSAAVVEYLE